MGYEPNTCWSKPKARPESKDAGGHLAFLDDDDSSSSSDNESTAGSDEFNSEALHVILDTGVDGDEEQLLADKWAADDQSLPKSQKIRFNDHLTIDKLLNLLPHALVKKKKKAVKYRAKAKNKLRSNRKSVRKKGLGK